MKIKQEVRGLKKLLYKEDCVGRNVNSRTMLQTERLRLSKHDFRSRSFVVLPRHKRRMNIVKYNEVLCSGPLLMLIL